MIKGTFPGQSEGAGSIKIIRNIAIKLGDFDGVARERRAHFLTQLHPGECAPTHSLVLCACIFVLVFLCLCLFVCLCLCACVCLCVCVFVCVCV